jgi:hypothetical protein
MAEVLYLTLKRKWFDMIASGEKLEEYREIKPYWVKRLCGPQFRDCDRTAILVLDGICKKDVFNGKNYDFVTAKNGYATDAPRVEWFHKGIRIGKPNPAWCEKGDENRVVFILEIGYLLED